MGTDPRLPLSGARAVRAHRMSIPEAAGTVNPSRILKGERKKVFDDLVNVLAPEDTPHPLGIRPCHLVQDERAVFKNDCSMLR